MLLTHCTAATVRVTARSRRQKGTVARPGRPGGPRGGGSRLPWAVGLGFWIARLLLVGLVLPLPVLARWGWDTWRAFAGASFLWQPFPRLFIFFWWPEWLRSTALALGIGWMAGRTQGGRRLLWIVPAAASLVTAYQCCALPLPLPLASLLLLLHRANGPSEAAVALAAILVGARGAASHQGAGPCPDAPPP